MYLEIFCSFVEIMRKVVRLDKRFGERHRCDSRSKMTLVSPTPIFWNCPVTDFNDSLDSFTWYIYFTERSSADNNASVVEETVKEGTYLK